MGTVPACGYSGQEGVRQQFRGGGGGLDPHACRHNASFTARKAKPKVNKAK